MRGRNLTNIFIYPLAGIVMLILSGCEAGSGEGLDEDEGPSQTLPFEPTLSNIQEQVFTPNCTFSGCHSGSSPAGQMNLEDGNAYMFLVNVPSTKANIRVVDGDADASFIIDKLEGNLSGTEGSRMPLGGPYLDQDVIDAIRVWIDNGAENN